MKTKQTLRIVINFLVFFFIFQSLIAQNVTRAVANGDWDESSTWDNGIPNGDKQAIISQGFRVNIVGQHNARELVIHGTLNVSENQDSDKSLETRWVHVNSGGVFQIGTAQNRFDQGTFTLTLTGTSPNSDQTVPMANGNNMRINDNDGFMMAGGNGRLQFFGEEKLPFTKLSETAQRGDNSITIANSIDNFSSEVNWEVGDRIVIASSVIDYRREDVRIIRRIEQRGDNTRLTLDRDLSNRHYGGIETYGNDLDSESRRPANGPISIDMRAEVALLSRNIKIQGLASQDTDNSFGDRNRLNTGGNGKATNGVGGHIMIMPTAGQISVEGVQLDRMGQAGRLGRYPFHWHIARDRSGDILKNSSITNSNNRAVVVHTTDNVIVEGNVAHDIHGHGFFTEDGVEVGNKFINNIVFGIHRVHPTRAGNGSAFVVDETDRFFDGGRRFRTTSAFWIANANNDYVGNVVAGSGGSGFWFAQPDRPRGAAAGINDFNNFSPARSPLATFIDNTVHSTSTAFVTRVAANNGRQPLFNGVDPVFENMTIYQTEVGLYPITHDVTHIFKNFKSSDNDVATHDSAPTLIDGGLMVRRSRGNASTSDDVVGVILYHGNAIFKDIHIAFNGRFFNAFNGGNQVRSGAEVEGLSFERGSLDNMNSFPPASGRSIRDVYDRDGSLTTAFGGGAGYSFIPNNDWAVDRSLGDIVSGGFRPVISKQRFGGLQSEYSDRNFPNKSFPRTFFTSPHGERLEFRQTQFYHRRIQLRLGAEYLVEFTEGFNPDRNKFQLTFSQWSLPNRSVSSILRFRGMANVIKPQVGRSGVDVRRVNNIGDLRSADNDAYFRAGNNDLYVKIMNRGIGISSEYLNFVAADAISNDPDTEGPTVSFESPQDGDTFAQGVRIGATVSASDVEGDIENVQLFLDGTLVRQESGAPYEWGADNSPTSDPVFDNLAIGEHTLEAIALDDELDTNSVSITITVLDPNEDDPEEEDDEQQEEETTISVSFQNPQDGEIFNRGTRIGVTVNASDTEQTMDNVQLFLDGTLVRQENAGPYEWGADNSPTQDPIFNNLAVGNHMLEAIAFNSAGESTSTIITIVVCDAEVGSIAIDTNATDSLGEETTVVTGGTSAAVLVGDGIANSIVLSNDNQSANFTYRHVVTDDSNDNIVLKIVDSNEIDFDTSELGTSYIWGWSFTDLDEDSYIGQPLQVLRDQNCSAVSNNFVEILSTDNLETLSVDDNQLAIGDLVIYPNPTTTGFINISLSGAISNGYSVNVYSVIGQIIMSETYTSQENRLQVSNLSDGMYFLEVIGNNSDVIGVKSFIKR